MGEKTKSERVEQIMGLLRPNTFNEDSHTWNSLREALEKKLSYGDLGSLYAVLLCKHPKA